MDYIMETTQNADAANTYSGAGSFKTSLSIRQRWSITHGARTCLISHLYDYLSIQPVQDITNELQLNNIKTSHKQVQNTIENFIRYQNPFCKSLNKQYLYNIATGVPVDPKTANFLTVVKQLGTSQR